MDDVVPMPARQRVAVNALCALLVAPACARHGLPARDTHDATPVSHVRLLDASIPGFRPSNRTRLNELLASRGRGSPGYNAARRPVAVFDWDNTMMRNDIGDATVYWTLLHDEIHQPTDRDWARTQPELTPEAITALHRACDSAAEPGAALPTSRAQGCAAELLTIFEDGHTTGVPSPAWRHETTLTSHAPYAWAASLLQGHTPDEVRAIAQRVYLQNREAPIGTCIQAVAGRSVEGVRAHLRTDARSRRCPSGRRVRRVGGFGVAAVYRRGGRRRSGSRARPCRRHPYSGRARWSLDGGSRTVWLYARPGHHLRSGQALLDQPRDHFHLPDDQQARARNRPEHATRVCRGRLGHGTSQWCRTRRC